MLVTPLRHLSRAWIAVLLLAGLAGAQEFRATVTGRVTDPAGLAMPGVTVSATNPQTNEVATAVTSSEGIYSLPFLRPGIYKVSAELEGFSKYEQDKVQLEVGSSRTINIQLAVGSVTEVVTVVSESEESSKADRGMVIDNTRVTELPLNARNPFMLSYLSPGITYNGPAIYQRPFDNGAIADWSINGGQNRNNEFLLDGAPNNAVQGGNNIAYVPPVDAVQEFKIVTNSYDAQYGRTAGGVINVSLKSGTNTFHGTAYEFARRKWLDSNEDLFIRNDREKPDHKLDQYGFQIDGPVRIPGLYDGRNKTFFMFNYEGYKEATPNPATYTFPDAAQLRGDFSNLRNAQGQLITIYDPATGRLENGQWVRDPFPGNRIPEERFSPIARNLLQYYPAPNTTPTSGDPWRNNFLFAPNLAYDTFYNIATKVDQNVSDKSKMFFRYAQNSRTEERYTNGITSGPAQDGQLPLERINYTGVADWVRTVSPSFFLNIRTSANQYIEAARSDPGLAFNPTELGFSSAMVGGLASPTFPRINITDYQAIGRQGYSRETTTVYSLQPNFSWTKGKHNIRGGLDMRLTWYTRESNGNTFRFDFDRRFTQRVFSTGDALSGNSFASFLLGASHFGQTDNNFFPQFRWDYYAPWIQDDWKLTDRLTVNLGFRWDLNTPVYERDNSLNYGFDGSVVNPVSSRINQQQFPGYSVNGGLGFVGVDGNPDYPYQYDKNNFQPRVGLAYALNDRTILRGGYGLYFLNPTGTTTQNGYAVSTALITSLDGDRTPTLALSDPFSQGIAPAPGNALGLETFLGRNPNFSNTEYLNPYVHQFSAGIQRQLGWRTSVEITYVGSRTRNAQSQWGGVNEPPASLRDQCDPTKGGNVGFCNQLLPNPFYQVPGFEGTARFTSPTLSRYELARPYPQFTGFTEFERNDGKIWYNSLQVYANKRVSDGLSLSGTYTWSTMDELGGAQATGGGNTFVDDQLRTLQRSHYFTDRRHRLTISGLYSLPFGHGRRFLANSHPVVNGILGGWDLAGMWLFNTGRPWQLPNNVFYVKDAKVTPDYSAEVIRGVQGCVAQMDNSGNVSMLAYAVANGCTEPNFIIRPSYTGRTTQFRDNDIRRPPFYQFDINFAKTTHITQNVRVQFRIELFNVLNQTIYDEREWNNDPTNAAFGTIDRRSVRQSNFPRYGQLGIKLLF